MSNVTTVTTEQLLAIIANLTMKVAALEAKQAAVKNPAPEGFFEMKKQQKLEKLAAAKAALEGSTASIPA